MHETNQMRRDSYENMYIQWNASVIPSSKDDEFKSIYNNYQDIRVVSNTSII